MLLLLAARFTRGGIMVVKSAALATFGREPREMQRFMSLRAYLACSAATTLLLLAMPRDAGPYSAEPAVLFEALDGTEIPNPVVDDLLKIAGETLAILTHMIPGF
jgi:hypothetical protein